jgi:hypothetical protein
VSPAALRYDVLVRGKRGSMAESDCFQPSAVGRAFSGRVEPAAFVVSAVPCFPRSPPRGDAPAREREGTGPGARRC